MRLSNVLSSGDRQFFDLFEEAGGNIQRAVGLLEELLAEYPERNELAREILICEQDGDRFEQRRVEYDWQASARAVRERVGVLPARRIELARFDLD